MKPKKIILIRHGQSKANVDRQLHGTTPDHKIPLTEKGLEQATQAGYQLYNELESAVPRHFINGIPTFHWEIIYNGKVITTVQKTSEDDNYDGAVKEVRGFNAQIGAHVGPSIRYYVSPYRRARETQKAIHESIIQHCPVRSSVYEDPRLREQEFGNYRPPQAYSDIEKERDGFGTFFYRISGGESGADVYDRVSGAMDTMHRDFQKPDFPDNVIIVSHGLTIRLFLMRWFHWTYEQFEALRNPKNCQYYVMARDVGDKYRLLTEMTTYDGNSSRNLLTDRTAESTDLTAHSKD